MMTSIRDAPEVMAIGGEELLDAGYTACEEIAVATLSELKNNTNLSEDELTAIQDASESNVSNLGFQSAQEVTPETDLSDIDVTDDGLRGWTLDVSNQSTAIWRSPYNATVRVGGTNTAVTVDAPIEPDTDDDESNSVSASEHVFTLVEGVDEETAINTAMEWMESNPVPDSLPTLELPGITEYSAEWLWFNNKVNTPPGLKSLLSDPGEPTYETITNAEFADDLRDALEQY